VGLKVRIVRPGCFDSGIIENGAALSSNRIDDYSPQWYSMLPANANRPWPPPARPWIMAMTWHDLLFAHWRVPAAVLRPHIPDRLQIDLYKGGAWLGIVPFGMRGTRPRWLPPVPGLSSFPELNVRTYVVAEGKPGVWFFSLDAASRLAVRGARAVYHLPYYDARMSLEKDKEGGVRYQSSRTHHGAAGAELEAYYRPVGEIITAAPGSLESWLTDRYCLYCADRHGRVFRGEIHHPPWPLQAAEAKWQRNTMTEQLGFPLPNESPLLHFSQQIKVVGWFLERVG
jgi:uncharacterized protein YqjF (DUF2071 family)